MSTPGAGPDSVLLQQDTFQDFAVGEFPYHYGAHREYHYWPIPGYRGRWFEPTIKSRWRSPHWLVLESGGEHLMVQTTLSTDCASVLVTGDPDWEDCAVSCTIRPLSLQGPCGLAARYQDSRNYYSLSFDGNGHSLQLLRHAHEGTTVLAETPCPYDCDTTYRFQLRVQGDRLTGFLDGVERLHARDATYARGRVALWAVTPARFGRVEVTTSLEARAAFDHRLNPLWTHPHNTGHYFRVYDVDGDGRDEVMSGYTLLDDDGSVIWQHTHFVDHADEIAIGHFDPDRGDLQIAQAAGEDGFLIFDQRGNLLLQDHVGHVQRVSVAKYRPDLPGLQYYVVTYWGNAGIILLYDCQGRRLHSLEPASLGNVLSPVNWTGQLPEYALLNASVRHGGLLDGWGRRVVVLPDDGHPELCAEALDLTGDARDELVVWDMDRVWIYTQDRPFRGERILTPARLPRHNASNYRADESLPSFHPLG